MITLLANITDMLALGMNEMMLICVCACAFVGAITGFIAFRASRKNKAKKDDNQTNEQQETLTREQAYLESNERGEIVMSRNVIYSAGIDGQIKSGKYVMKSADGATDKFNVRVNGLVREYASGDVVILTDGDTVSPVSGAVVLSSCEE